MLATFNFFAVILDKILIVLLRYKRRGKLGDFEQAWQYYFYYNTLESLFKIVFTYQRCKMEYAAWRCVKNLTFLGVTEDYF